MREFDAWNFVYNVHELTKFIWIAVRHDDKEEIPRELLSDLHSLVEQMQHQTLKMQLKMSHKRAAKELRLCLLAYGAPTWGKVKAELQVLWEIMEPEIRERRFACIDINKGEYLNDLLGDPLGIPPRDRKKTDPAWKHIWDRFPTAKYDCEEAVYCYALERDTAAVFHSMRVAEIGLRALARRMKIGLPKGKKLEWGEWQAILKEMSKKTEAIGQTAKAGPRKDDLLEFYNGAIGQFTGFKDEFRNQVMHVRKSYDEFDAQKSLTRVRDFMEKLADKIDEKGRLVRTEKDFFADL
jgi:hypothetical protein